MQAYGALSYRGKLVYGGNTLWPRHHVDEWERVGSGTYVGGLSVRTYVRCMQAGR